MSAALPQPAAGRGPEAVEELVVLSGKGGTGKTSVLASLAVLAGGAVMADCDVDAPDLHLVLAPEIRMRTDFIAGQVAVIDADACSGCGECASRCRFGAITLAGNAGAEIERLACEGCGVCARVCPEKAIEMVQRRAGEWMVSRTRSGPMVHARLAVGGSSSGKLVSEVRRQARLLAALERRRLILVDGPPGVGCPVIASLTGATYLLVVTEPTPAGEHDLGRVLELAAHFRVPAAVCVNRWDLHPGRAHRIERLAVARGAACAGRIRYDRAVTTAQVGAVSVVEHGGGAAGDLRALWRRLGELWPELGSASAAPAGARGGHGG